MHACMHRSCTTSTKFSIYSMLDIRGYTLDHACLCIRGGTIALHTKFSIYTGYDIRVEVAFHGHMHTAVSYAFHHTVLLGETKEKFL